jgi:hypothetical protein
MPRRCGACRRRPTGCWTTGASVTLAEAELLLGDFSAARRSYVEAFERHARQQGNIVITCRQLGAILRALGVPWTVEEFLAGPTAEAP